MLQFGFVRKRVIVVGTVQVKVYDIVIKVEVLNEMQYLVG